MELGFRLFGRAWVEELECRILGHGPRAQGSQLWRGFYMGSCQNYGPFLGTLNNRCRIIIRTQKGTLILTTTQWLWV